MTQHYRYPSEVKRDAMRQSRMRYFLEARRKFNEETPWSPYKDRILQLFDRDIAALRAEMHSPVVDTCDAVQENFVLREAI